MKLLRDQVSVVFLGSFAPAMIEPEWLIEHCVITPKEYAAGERQSQEPKNQDLIVLVTHQVSQLTLGGLQFLCDNSRLTINANSQDLHPRCQEISLAILAALPSLPASAVGLNRNFLLEVPDSDYWHKIGHNLIQKTPFWSALGGHPGTMNATVRYRKCKVKDAELTVITAPDLSDESNNRIIVNTNYNFGAPSPAPRAQKNVSRMDRATSVARVPITMKSLAFPFENTLWNSFYSNALEIADAVHRLGV